MTMLCQNGLSITAFPPTSGAPLARSTASNSASQRPVGSLRRSTLRSATWNRQSLQKPSGSAGVPDGLACVYVDDGAAIAPSLGCTRRSGLACHE